MSAIGGQLQIDLLEARTADEQLLQPLSPGERLGGELVQQPRGVVGLPLHELARGGAVGDAVARAAAAQLARGESLQELSVGRPTLEDLYLELTADE